MYLNSIDINADVGEGINNESELLPYISSCNIACGGHAGDVNSMIQVVQLAKKNNVKIGAHPSFPDRKNFGRKPMDISCAALFSSIKAQIKSLLKVARDAHYQLHHVKPHGALYNLAAVDKATAEVIIEALKGIQQPLKLYVPYNSIIAELAISENIPITYEAFADRNYNNDLTLVSRTHPKALITDRDQLVAHVKQMIWHNQVKTITGDFRDIEAETYCIHGDNPKANDLVKYLVNALKEAGVKIQ